MNIQNFIIISAAFALAACSNQNEPDGDMLDAPVAAEFSAGIGEPISRAHDSSWDTGDAIGISGRFISGGTSTITHNNVKYTVSSTSTGEFVPATTGGGIFFQNTLPVTFSAYYPFGGTSGTANEEISTSTLSQSSSKSFDFLWAEAENSASYKSPSVKFNFTHKMTRLILQLNTDANGGFSATDVSKCTYKLSGIRHSGTFNATTGVAEATGPATDNWVITGTSSTSNNVRTYSLILFPQTADKLTLTASIGGKDYACDITPGLKAGTSYTYTITVRKTGLEVSNATITGWTAGTSGTGTATYVDPFNGHTAVLMREASGTSGSANYVPALYIADRNVGAATPEDAGLYFWWGDTEGVYYDKANNALTDKNGNVVTYNNGIEAKDDNLNNYFNSGNNLIDTYNKSLSTLYDNGNGSITSTIGGSSSTGADNSNAAKFKSEYDAATKHMGSPWRMMTIEDTNWLREECTWTKEEDENGNYIGATVHSNETGNEVFLPATGYFTGTRFSTGNDHYWSATPSERNQYAFTLCFTNGRPDKGSQSRYEGMAIRAVADK